MVARLISLLLPVLFPSWRFFKDVGPSPRIEVPEGDGWVSALPRPDRIPAVARVGHLFYNRRRNEDLFLCSLAERLLAEGRAETETMLQVRLARRLGVSRSALVFRIVLLERVDGAICRTLAYEHS